MDRDEVEAASEKVFGILIDAIGDIRKAVYRLDDACSTALWVWQELVDAGDDDD